MKLGDVCRFVNGFAFKSTLFKESGDIIIRITNISELRVDFREVKFFDPNDYSTDLSAFMVKKGDILIAMSGATTGKIGRVKDSHKAYINQRVGRFVPNENIILNSFLFHFLLTKTKEIYIMAGGGAQPNLSSTQLMSNIIIPIPPLSEQDRIVSILDRFEALTTDLTAGLPAEIKARQQQYEYYRDQLLTFKRAN